MCLPCVLRVSSCIARTLGLETEKQDLEPNEYSVHYTVYRITKSSVDQNLHASLNGEAGGRFGTRALVQAGMQALSVMVRGCMTADELPSVRARCET